MIDINNKEENKVYIHKEGDDSTYVCVRFIENSVQLIYGVAEKMLQNKTDSS